MTNPNVIYGLNPVLEALESGVDLETVWIVVGLRATTRRDVEAAAQRRGIRVFRTDRKEMDRLTSDGVHQGVMATQKAVLGMKLEQLAALTCSPRTVICCLDGIQDPHNLGAIARSAYAFGAAGLVIPARRCVGVTPAAIKASAGALSHLPVVKVNNLARTLDFFKEMGYWISGAVLEGGSAPWEYDPGEKAVLLLGSEGEGIRSGLEEKLDYRVKIPMRGKTESLNVSVAGALVLYEWLCRTDSCQKR